MENNEFYWFLNLKFTFTAIFWKIFIGYYGECIAVFIVIFNTDFPDVMIVLCFVILHAILIYYPKNQNDKYNQKQSINQFILFKLAELRR